LVFGLSAQFLQPVIMEIFVNISAGGWNVVNLTVQEILSTPQK
jgi:hypothetical protein